MINIVEKLNSIDIKDIKVNEIIETLKTRIDISVNIGCIFILLISLVIITNKYNKKNAALSAEISTLTEIQSILETEKTIQQTYTDFLTNFPKPLDRDKLSDIISEYTTKHQINLDSFAPAKEIKDKLKETIYFNIKISSNNYKNIILFIRDVETSPYALTIEQWVGKSQNSTMMKEDEQSKIISAEINIGTTKLINE